MAKKTTVLFFILLANIVLLAYAVIPHHHHNNQVCIVNAHCQTDSQAHKHKSDNHDHQHDGKDNSDCCVLKKIVAIPSNLVKQECKCTLCSDDHSNFDGFQFTLADNEIGVFVPIELNTEKLLFLSSNYYHFVTSALGLRAPPAV